MTRRYFGTDGIRGRVGDAVINPVFMLKLGWAIGTVLLDERHQTVLIGRDTRMSGTLLESALQAGLAAAGAHVRTLGVIPTPAVAYLTPSMHAALGIVISASHNPYDDNGVKIFDKNGFKLSDQQELAIEALLDQPLTMVSSAQLAEIQPLAHDASERYMAFCRSTFPSQLSLRHLKIVIDAAHGAGYYVGPAIFKELGATVIAMGCEPNGFNINQDCGALHTAALQRRVVAEQADLGIALDGDGDRLLLVDHQGEVVDGDEILGILAQGSIVDGDRLGVVGTLMTNLGLEQALAQWGIPFERSNVGDRYVLERLLEKGWTLGGEASGHIINLDFTTTGDGIVSALQVLRVMQMQQQSLHTLKQVIIKRPQLLKNMHFSGSADILTHTQVQSALDRLTLQFNGRGRILLRLSGTEPLLRVMAEGDDLAEVEAVVDELIQVITEVVARQ